MANRYKSERRVQIDEPQPPKFDAAGDDSPGSRGIYGDGDGDGEGEHSMRFKPSANNVTEDQEPFMGFKVRRKASLHRDYKGDYLGVPSHPFLMKILQKQGQLRAAAIVPDVWCFFDCLFPLLFVLIGRLLDSF